MEITCWKLPKIHSGCVVKEYASFLKLFSEHLDTYTFELSDKSPKELYAPESYILSLGGKRIRPLLALIACDLFDKKPELALNAALAVELFHNFSLIHDDILDTAPLRRNKPTVHIKWNTNIALLSGDVILVKAFQSLESYEPAVFKTLSILFNRTAIEVCEGQQLDMNFEGSDSVPVNDYLDMIRLKTAVLLGCSLRMGAIASGADVENQEHLYNFGVHLGISFQLLDDLLDAFADDPEKFGKQTGGDIIANKKTFLLLKALELSDTGQRAEIRSLLTHKNPDKKVTEMLRLYTKLNVKALCQEEADKHTQIAIDCLSRVKASEEKKEKLRRFALELLNRQM